MSRALEVGKAYVAAVNDKDLDTLLGYFEPDGVLQHPFGTFEGHVAIGEFYSGLVFHADTEVSFAGGCGDEHMAALELVGISPQAPDTPQYACDIFQVNDGGKISSLKVYYLNTVGG